LIVPQTICWLNKPNAFGKTIPLKSLSRLLLFFDNIYLYKLGAQKPKVPYQKKSRLGKISYSLTLVSAPYFVWFNAQKQEISQRQIDDLANTPKFYAFYLSCDVHINLLKLEKTSR
jgi:hypothetical protein